MDESIFKPECLSCGALMSEIKALGFSLQTGLIDCPKCSEQHRYTINTDVMSLFRISVPIGYTGSTEKTIYPIGKPTLISAVKAGDLETVAHLLDGGAQPDMILDDTWETPLLVAASNGFLEIVKLLLARGANPNMSDKYGWSPLSCVQVKGFLDIVKVLEEHGATYAADEGPRLLNNAAEHGNLEGVKYLIEEKGVPLDQQTGYSGWTPLHSAACGGHIEVVRYLLSRGADPYKKHKFDADAFMVTEGAMKLTGVTQEQIKVLREILSLLREKEQKSLSQRSTANETSPPNLKPFAPKPWWKFW